jgi:capsular polysaccharide transport system ATP-binding protein
MLLLRDITKQYKTNRGDKIVLNKVNLTLEKGEKLGILGRNGAGKSTLVRLIGGSEAPTSGKIIRGMKVSWPLAFSEGFQGQLSGLDNMRFVCRIYNKSSEDKIQFVQEFSELGDYFREPVMNYSSGMCARLAFAISMIVEFDCYLIDEVMAVGDSRFTQKCQEELFVKRGDRAMVIVTHSEDYVRAHCDKVAVLLRGQLHHFDSIDQGFEFYHRHASEH